MRFLRKLRIKRRRLRIGDDNEASLRIRADKFAKHRLVIVFRHEPAYDQIVFSRLGAFERKPLPGKLQAGGGFLRRQVRHIRAIGKKAGFRPEPAVSLPDIRFYIGAVADHQVRLPDHLPLRILPVLFDRRTPLGPQPFMPVRIQVNGSSELFQNSAVPREKRPDPAGQHVHDGIADPGLFDIIDAVFQGFQIIENRFGGPDRPHGNDEALNALIVKDLLTGQDPGLIQRAGDVIADILRFPPPHKLLHESLKPAVSGGNALTAYNKYVFLFLCHHFTRYSTYPATSAQGSKP